MGAPTNDGAAIVENRSDQNHETARQTDSPYRSILFRWLLHDAPFIIMLVLALVGLVFRLPVSYWVILIPIFGIISIFAGWSHFETRQAHLALVYSQTLNWGALMLAIYLLYTNGVHGVLNSNADTLVMMILLALGTFVAGVRAKVWQICAVGAVLFLAVPGLGWLDQSPLLLTAATLVIITLGGFAWWVSEGHKDAGKPSHGPSIASDR